ncbi:MAG TPA: DedA family protein [Candidatus Dormibacteraeota bacterium]|nr:DedA family protein [Candidatus Dormibacteraeota bacterium]
MLQALASFAAFELPDWLREPSWWRPLTRAVRLFVLDHQTGGLFFVIFFEELGVPLPAPGDVAILYGGYLTTTGAIPYPMAYLAVVGGAVLGSACNLTISRRYGRPFIKRFGRYIGITDERMLLAERIFKRWGPLAIIVGRHIPGMRIVLSALSGILGVPYKVFIPCVLVSASIWAFIFLELGRRLGPRARVMFGLFPAHLLPWLVTGFILLAIGYLAYEHGFKPKEHRDPVEHPR